MSAGLQGLIPELELWATALIRVGNENGIKTTLTSTFRSIKTQTRLYNDFRSGRRTTVAAPPGRSLHNYGHAFDLVARTDSGQRWLGEVWEHWGGRWGGRFNDPIHFDTGATIPRGA